jgi:hypothetical protein
VSRQKLIVGLVVMIGMVIAIAGVVSSRSPEIRARFNQVREGMTYDEVTALLGQPNPENTPFATPGPGQGSCLWVYWDGRDGTAYIGFDAAKRQAQLMHFQPASADFLSRTLGWLGL